MLPSISNPFWKSVSKALKLFHHKVVENSPVKLSIDSPMWYNPAIYIESVKQWDNRGLRRAGDVLDEQLNIKTIAKLSEDFNIKFNFLDYTRLTRTLPPSLLIQIIEHDEGDIVPWCQEHIQLILGDNKSNQLIKRAFLDQTSFLRLRRNGNHYC